MAYAESKAKLGNRGSAKGEKTFNTKSGTRESSRYDGMNSSYQGVTKGKTKHIKKG